MKSSASIFMQDSGNNSPTVDKGLVAMFLKMSPDERLLVNNNAISTILELRNAFRERKTDPCRSRSNT